MRVMRIPANSGTTERRCHCGARFNGSDHCPFCGCEQYERYCDAAFDADRPDHGLPATQTWCAGDRANSYQPNKKAS